MEVFHEKVPRKLTLNCLGILENKCPQIHDFHQYLGH